MLGYVGVGGFRAGLGASTRWASSRTGGSPYEYYYNDGYSTYDGNQIVDTYLSVDYKNDGIVGDGTTASGCTTCPVGRHQADAGSSSCHPCPAGTYQEAEYDDREQDPGSCFDCPEGQNSEGAASSCAIPDLNKISGSLRAAATTVVGALFLVAAALV